LGRARAASPPLTAENGHANCSRVQSVCRRYATSTSHNNGIYCASMASRDKNTTNLNLADIYSIKSSSMSNHSSVTKVICEELRSHPSRKEWTRPHRVLLAAQCSLQTSPVIQLRVRYIHTAVPHDSISVRTIDGIVIYSILRDGSWHSREIC